MTSKNQAIATKAAKVVIPLAVLATAFLAGCQREMGATHSSQGSVQERTFVLEQIESVLAAEHLSTLDLYLTCTLDGDQTLTIAGSPAQLQRAATVLALVDSAQEFAITTLAPASQARTLPSNDRIAQSLGHVAIGTFADPPALAAPARGIVDVHGDSVIAILPARLEAALDEALVEAPSVPIQTASVVERATEHVTVLQPTGVSERPEVDSSQRQTTRQAVNSSENGNAAYRSRSGRARPAVREARVVEVTRPAVPETEVLEVRPNSIVSTTDANEPVESYELSSLPNGDDTLELNLPQTIGLAHLLDLAAEFLELDYMYDPEQVKGQTITLKLHGKLQGRIRIKDLYPLLESVLKFKGFAMTRHEGRLVTVVPLEDALHEDPTLVGPETDTLEPGDMVITRVLDLQYVDALSATRLLQDMQLSVAIAPVEETRSLIVTCYAHRMARIERLLKMIDRPGRPKRFRSRQLKYTMAEGLVARLQVLAEEFETVPVTIASLQTQPTSDRQAGPTLRPSGPSSSLIRTANARPPQDEVAVSGGERTLVYVDADVRTNRILMLGYEEQVALVDDLIDALDLPGYELQTVRVYYLDHIDAAEAKVKLDELGMTGAESATELPSRPTVTQVASTTSRTVRNDAFAVRNNTDIPVRKPQIIVLEASNALLVNATEEQHLKIERVATYIDVAADDLRYLSVYDIEHVDAEDIRDKLLELGVITVGGQDQAPPSYRTVRAPTQANAPTRAQFAVVEEEGAPSGLDQAQVVVRESTNSLVVYATEPQHLRIEETIGHLDAEALDQAIPYEIYFLENQDPETLAETVGRLIKETVTDNADKIEEAPRRPEDQITIVPDKGTFSLIVYASRKNQDWISKLITALDKRRPQVLIDVTLVEITETDSFSYDLSMIRGWPNLEGTSGISGVSPGTDTTGTLLDSAAGSFTAFYGDAQVQALLTAVQSKNYGRVLAKPKVLVNDNEPGLIKTTDTTYVTIETAIPVSSGGTNDATLVQTQQKYEPYEAGITLDITPHISEGDLLRLAISLTRSDFLPTESQEKPPNTTASEVKTAVTVPDGSTIILGGLLKLNQNKGDTRVPILGDIPIIGGLFRGASNSDKQSKLYVFVKAEIIRPAGRGDQSMEDLARISQRDRAAFEGHEAAFQQHETWPGVTPEPMTPARVLEAR